MIKKSDIITIKVTSFTKEWNKDMIPQFEELEKIRFKGKIRGENKRKAVNYVTERFGSAFLQSCCEIYVNGKRVHYFDL